MKSLYLRKQKGLLSRPRLLRNLTPEDFVSNAALVMAANEAIDILNEVKRKDGLKEREKKKEPIAYVKKL